MGLRLNWPRGEDRRSGGRPHGGRVVSSVSGKVPCQGRLTARLGIPKSFLLALDRADKDLFVTLTLFGVAGNWTGEAADALVRGLRNGLDTRGTRRPLEVIERAVNGTEGLPVPNLSADALLGSVQFSVAIDSVTLPRRCPLS